MGVSRILSCCAVACALAVGAAGCGDSGTTDAGSDSTAQQSTQQSTGATTDAKSTPWTGKVPAAHADIAQRLEEAGYKPSAQKNSKPTKADPGYIRVLMHEGAATFINVLANGVNQKVVDNTVARSRGRLAAEIVGSHVYVVSSGLDLLDPKEELTDEQIAEFHEIVAAVSGQ